MIRMKTTLNIDDAVMQRLREEAAQQGKLMAVVEAGLRRVLSRAPDESGPLAELATVQSGGMRIDVADRDRLY